MKMDPGLKADRCEVCRGTGKTYLEHEDGSLSEQSCPFCHGSKNAVWRHEQWQGVQRRRTAKAVLPRLAIVVLLVVFGLPLVIRTASVELLVFWLLGVVGLSWWTWDSRASKRTAMAAARAARKPDPLTTPEEMLLGTALIAGVALKVEHDARVHRTDAKLDQIIRNQDQQQRGF